MVKQEKIKAVEQLKEKIEKYPVIGVVDLFKLPTKQLQDIQKNLRGRAEFIVVKKSVLTHAMSGAQKEKIKDLEGKIPTQPALVFTEMDPFKFYINVDKMKAPTFAKEGDIAEEEVFIPAGPTSLMAGPVISEFAKVKIPAGVEEGKIAVKKDTVAAKKGDVISKDLSSILRKLKIQPVKIGINVTAVYDKGTIYLKEVLSLAGEGYVKMLQQAHQFAVNLSVASGYPTTESIKYLLAKAHLHAQALQSKVKTEAPATESPKSEEVKTETNQGGGAS
jgi:large subunit ribosomal protein L10